MTPTCATRTIGYPRERVRIRRERNPSLAVLFPSGLAFFAGLLAIGVGVSIEGQTRTEGESTDGTAAFATGGTLMLVGAGGFAAGMLVGHGETAHEATQDGVPFDETSEPFACGTEESDADRAVEVTVTKQDTPILRFGVVTGAQGGAASMTDIIAASAACGEDFAVTAMPVAGDDEMPVERHLELPTLSGTPNARNVADIVARCCAISEQSSFEKECEEDCRDAAGVDGCFSGRVACDRAAEKSNDPDTAVDICEDLFDECLTVNDVDEDGLATCARQCALSRAERACKEAS